MSKRLTHHTLPTRLTRHALLLAVALPLMLAACGKKEDAAGGSTTGGGMTGTSPAPMSPSPMASGPSSSTMPAPAASRP